MIRRDKEPSKCEFWYMDEVAEWQWNESAKIKKQAYVVISELKIHNCKHISINTVTERRKFFYSSLYVSMKVIYAHIRECAFAYARTHVKITRDLMYRQLYVPWRGTVRSITAISGIHILVWLL
jgi:hypothetical protein